MLGKIRTAVSEALPTPGSTPLPVPGSLADDDSSREESRLYECPACDTVYVATAPHQCVTCRTTVEPVDES